MFTEANYIGVNSFFSLSKEIPRFSKPLFLSQKMMGNHHMSTHPFIRVRVQQLSKPLKAWRTKAFSTTEKNISSSNVESRTLLIKVENENWPEVRKSILGKH